MTRRIGFSDYEGLDLPPLVAAAVAAAAVNGFPRACTPETGRLLFTLAAHVDDGKIGELGTACGVGAAWLSSGMRHGTRLVTVELDPGRAAVASSVFTDRSDVVVITGDWRNIAPHAPFDLLFSDGGPKREPDAPDLLLPLVRPGGFLILDDYTPEAVWTDPQRTSWSNDSSRKVWMDNPHWSAIEVQIAPDMAAIIAVRLD